MLVLHLLKAQKNVQTALSKTTNSAVEIQILTYKFNIQIKNQLLVILQIILLLIILKNMRPLIIIKIGLVGKKLVINTLNITLMVNVKFTLITKQNNLQNF